MAAFKLRYEPENLAFGDRATWVSATDGDTPALQFPVRMLGMDAPELHYKGADEDTPGKFDQPFSTFLATAGAFLEDGLKAYLAPRLGNNACTKHITAGKAAFDHFAQIVAARLDRGVGRSGRPLTPRKLFVMAAQQVFDHNGRLLAYLNANYTREERESIPAKDRPTFNLQMMQDGHAVSLLIYPNVPKASDLKLVQSAVAAARETPKGFWQPGDQVLLPYEFRWIIDTIGGARQGPDRFCGDLVTGDLYFPQQYYHVLPENRLFFFAEDVGYAIGMGFKLKM